MFQVCVCCVVLSSASSGDVDTGQFLRTLKDLSADLRDVSFVYEGENRYVGPKDLEEEVRNLDISFQGYFVYRSDHSALLDLFTTTGSGDQQTLRHVISVFDDASTSMVISDPSRESGISRQERASLAHMANVSYTPLKLFEQWSASRLTEDRLAKVGFQASMREDSRGRSIMRVEMDPQKYVPITEHRWTQVSEYDLSRNGNKVLQEEFLDGKLARRLVFTLDQFMGSDGKMLWFPIGATEEGFAWKGRCFDQPLFVTNYKVVTSTVRLNECIPDELFDISRDRSGRFSPELRRFASEFAKKKPPKADSKAIDESLDERIQIADEQSKELDASRPVGGPPIWATTGGVVAAGVGLVFLSLWLRGRR